jgi:hypothetical protein
LVSLTTTAEKTHLTLEFPGVYDSNDGHLNLTTESKETVVKTKQQVVPTETEYPKKAKPQVPKETEKAEATETEELSETTNQRSWSALWNLGYIFFVCWG